ncbi:neuraminidase-like domain-containing protein [Photorhabdus australis]|uniref:Tc toxin subunit A-related protein n=1 Tax=Photorhabdus australis TaxID=286156 RepID=UPI0005644942|nr:neuraminidase-like domain-containing protein [Photorhabdus australis]
MYHTDDILEKLNNHEKTPNGLKSGDNRPVTLPDIMVRSFAEVKALAGDSLTWGETNFLYKQAQQELKENKMTESRILSRANPQLANAVRLGIRQSSMLRSYDDLFGGRASKFVKPGSVASMFSPAGYLTELYREARKLHPDDSEYNLDKRRPDLASLSLSQNNMDDELSTLSLSNELLLNTLQTKENNNYDGVMEMLSAYRQTGMTPFHLPYETVRQAIMLQDAEFAAFRRNPAVAQKMDTASLLSINADISPELYEILTEEITEANVDELIKKNFGENTNTSIFQNIAYLARYYGLTYDELTSLLGMVSVSSDVKPGVQYYKNDQLITLLNDDGQLNAVLIRRTEGGNAYQFGYAELVPTGLNNYLFNFTIVNNAKAGSMQVGTSGYGSKDIFSSENIDVKSGVPISLPVTLSDEQIKKTVNIGVTRVGGGYYANVNYDISQYPFSVFLLKLNKLIRLYKATGIAPSDIRTVIESSNPDLTLTRDVLSQLFWVNYYMQTYGIDVSAALVLSGAAISQISHDNQASAFTRLFNSPPLNNQEFSADGVVLNLEPDTSKDAFRRAAIKRALQVNDTELYILYTLTSTDKDTEGKDIAFTTTIGNLSALYRTRLLAEVNNLSVTELSMLLSVSPYAGRKLDTLTGSDLSGLVSFITRYTLWLKDQNWTVSDVYLMTTEYYNTSMTTDIESLVTVLRNDVQVPDGGWHTADMACQIMAPVIAPVMQLESAEIAKTTLLWVDHLKPDGWAGRFLKLVLEGPSQGSETEEIVTFYRVLVQMALIVHTLGLTENELQLAVTQPIEFQGVSPLLHDIATVRSLARFHGWLQQCGTSATEVLSALGGGTLTPVQLAQAMCLDELIVAQGLAQLDSTATTFSSWTEVDITLQWVDMATTLGITPDGVSALIKVKLSATAGQTPYSEWVSLSHMLQAGLSSRQTTQLQATLDEALSTAISAYAIKNIAPSGVTDRDKLYSWLLLDNQVSAQVKTTRLAEAIASVQLYVNRALSGQETGVDNTVRARPFFTDWDTYNKRYSTWAGVSELVYYPENYVDPTLRLGQTGMMNEMLQSLSQSQLTSDSVEEAFKTYMTRFEEIANLDIISGYHDSVSDQKGTTYLIGRSAIGDYYWRSADIGKMSSDGKLPANAWCEWKKITAAISAVNNLVRPVIFQSRLYLVWVEGKAVATTTNNTTTTSTEYALKYAHILHDGTWSAPVSITLQNEIIMPGETNIANIGMYSAQDVDGEPLEILFYKKQDSYSKDKYPSDISGLRILSDGSSKNIDPSVASAMAGYIYPQLDTTTDVRLNTPYAGGETRVSVSGWRQKDYTWGYKSYTIMFGSKLSDITATFLKDTQQVSLKFNATARVVYNGVGGCRSRTLVDMMKSVGSIGDVFYLPQTVDRSNIALSSGRNFECVFKNRSDNTYDAAILVTDGISPVSGDKIYGFNDSSADKLNSASAVADLYSFTLDTNHNKLWRRIQTNFKPENYVYALMSPVTGVIATLPISSNELMFSNFVQINTQINPGNVKLDVTEASKAFTSDKRSKYTFDESLFDFTNKEVSVPLSAFSGNTAQVSFMFRANAPTGDERPLGSETLSLTLTRVTETSLPAITLNRTEEGAQYLQYGVYRIRVNTLFAKQLVARANAGLDTVLSMATQQIEEPKLGEGFYANFVLSKYDPDIHGDECWFHIKIGNIDGSAEMRPYYQGELSDTETSVRLFIPYAKDFYCHEGVRLGVEYKKANYYDKSWEAAFFYFDEETKKFVLINDADHDSAMSLAGKVSNVKKYKGFDEVSVLNNQTTEPMDFNGANALYFWEMFYYVPMMVFKRLLQESRFTEATQWIKYIWNPEGYYLMNGQPALYQWNVRPLQEETTWHANPLDSVDPDAVAQADPMHYKVATFMSYLDLLIARGDAAYRQLERDTLNEAKMWYVQALDVLGDEPYLTPGTDWRNPRLTDAANQTAQKTAQQALQAVRQQITAGKLRTANSLTALFLPQQNEKLQGYWQTLAQRLYNLRHNLSIDGQPLLLSVYAKPADPAALLSAAVNASQGGSDLPAAVMPLYRFPVMLESAKGMVSQLSQFGSTLLGITERQDAEALSELLQTQGAELVRQSIALQEKTLAEIDADQIALQESRNGAQSRLDSYTALYDEHISSREQHALNLSVSAAALSTTSGVSYSIAAGLDAAPNIYGMAFGGCRYGGLARAVGICTEIAAGSTRAAADYISQSEAYRRRRQEWDIQRNAAESEVKQIDAQLDALTVRREAAVLQKTYLETQQSQTQAQLTFLQNKFSNKALYNWLRGKLAAIYYQFYDLTVSRCLMAQQAYQWEFNDESASFIKPGAWQGTYGGLLAGETLMLNLAQMEEAHLKQGQRALEVERTLSLAEFYGGLSSESFNLAEKIVELVGKGSGNAGNDSNTLAFGTGTDTKTSLQASISLSDLKIMDDYPASTGKIRRIKQISVSLPALLGPYQDIQAILSYGGDATSRLAKGCQALAVSHGMNDSGQFQLDFNDGKFLPFEGIAIDDKGALTLSFPNATGKQKALLLSLSDIILHIRYTIMN